MLTQSLLLGMTLFTHCLLVPRLPARGDTVAIDQIQKIPARGAIFSSESRVRWRHRRRDSHEGRRRLQGGYLPTN